MKKTIITLTVILATIICNGQEKKDTAKVEPTYFLLGKLADWQMLYKAIVSPMDVTPNQMKQLSEWIAQVKPLPEQPAVKPKEEKPKIETPKN